MDLTTMTTEELRDYMDAGRDELDRRDMLIAEARNGRPKGPGRPPKNGVARLKTTDLEPVDTDS
jgi:hypothetical protein